MCPICNNEGVVLVDIGTATIPDYVETPCKCVWMPTDEDAPDWEPMGTTPEDFRPAFNDNRYVGL
jgi:hypothetical protein